MDSVSFPLKILLLCFISLIFACRDSQSPKESSVAIPDSYVTYQKNGIRFSYPKYWTFSYDSTPSVYAGRGIGLKLSEFSSVTILVSEDRDIELSNVTDRMLGEFQLRKKDSIEDFERSGGSIAEFPVEIATWDDHFLSKTRYEMTVAKVQNRSVDIFVVFSLSGEDIPRVQEHKYRFLKSIHVQ